MKETAQPSYTPSSKGGSDKKPPSAWYVAAMGTLVQVVQDLSQAHDLDAITSIVKHAARDLTGADGATFVLRDGNFCYYAEENAISPLWKGGRFPMENCVSGWVMANAKPVVIPDIYGDARIPVDVYKPTFVKSMAMVPIRRNAPIGAIGNYWARQRKPTDEELQILQVLADTTSVALENANLYSKLQNQVTTLQAREKRIQDQHYMLEVFSRALVHDLKEPLRTIHAFSRLILDETQLTGNAGQLFQHVHNNADRMLMLLDTVFNYTQLDAPLILTGQQHPVDRIVAEAQENLGSLIRSRQATITHDPLPQVQANRLQLIQVFQNLIANAIHHQSGLPVIHVGARQEGDKWRFTVRDNGPGIDKKYQQVIFEPFKRLNPIDHQGAGLGLSICKKIVNAHGGDIWCEASGPSGTSFAFTLPLTPALADAPPENLRLNLTSIGADEAPMIANVLLVDDREADIILTRIMLNDRFGIRSKLFVAQSGEEALDVMRARSGGKEPIHLVLLDINMPTMDGFDVLELMRNDEKLRDVPVLVCTGSSYTRDVERALSLGANGYLVKPIQMDPLKHMVEQINGLQLKPHKEGYDLVHQ